MQALPWLTAAPQVFVCLKPALTDTLEMFNVAFPVLVTVTLCEALALPTAWLENVRLDGEMETAGAEFELVAVPFNGTLWGLEGSESATVNVAAKVPAATGTKLIDIVQLAAAATL